MGDKKKEDISLEESIELNLITSDKEIGIPISSESSSINGALIDEINEILIANTPGPIHGGMSIAIVMAIIVSRYMSHGNVEATEHNIDQLCKMAKDLARKFCMDRLPTRKPPPPEGHVLN